MRKIIKKYFIPHVENNFHPHILHTKRAIFYSLVFLFCKLIVFVFALALPVAVFTSPDVLASESKKIFSLTNNLRNQNNLYLLNSNDRLERSATAKGIDMAQNSYFSHASPNGKTVVDFVSKTGYRYEVVGENLAVGFATAEDVMAAWQKSPTHLANLMDKDYIDLGVSMEEGKYEGQETVFAVQHFATPIKVALEKPEPKLALNQKITTKKQSVAKAPNKTVAVAIADQTTKEVLSEKVITPEIKKEELVGTPFWENPIQKYGHIKLAYQNSDIFSFSNNLFLFAIIFFGLALVLSVVIEIRKQHPHIIVQTTGLVGLLVVLFLA